MPAGNELHRVQRKKCTALPVVKVNLGCGRGREQLRTRDDVEAEL